MFKLENKFITIMTISLLIMMIVFTIIDWSVDGFDLLKAQQYEFYFQSFVSISGLAFTSIMAITIFIIYKKTKLPSLKYMSLSFLLTSFAYFSIGYHSSYCKVCSDLTMCSASHNYSNYLIVIAFVIFVLTVLLVNIKNSISILKLFSYGLITASSILLIVLFISIQFIETPGILFYELSDINLQGFVFIFPLFLMAFTLIYLRKKGKIKKVVFLIFSLLSLSFIPQAYHIFLCKECHVMECSEFYVFAGLLMHIALGLFIYSLSQQIKEENS